MSKRARLGDESGFVRCPCCGKDVAARVAAQHVELCLMGKDKSGAGSSLERERLALKDSDTNKFPIKPVILVKPVRTAFGTAPQPPGLSVVGDFLSVEEEKSLLAFLSKAAWGPARFGVDCLAVSWGSSWEKQSPADLPPEFAFIVRRFQQRPELQAWWPNQANANKYVRSRNHFLRDHVDDRFRAGEIIVNISLCSDAIMTFRKINGTVSFDVPLPRRGASIMAYASRWEFTHGIKPENFLGEERISVNFRQTTGYRGPR